MICVWVMVLIRQFCVGLKELRAQYTELGTGWWSQVMRTVMGTSHFCQIDASIQENIVASGLVSVDMLRSCICAVKSDESERIRKRVEDSRKHAWLLVPFPDWSTVRPHKSMGGSCARARALSRWLLGEHNLEVETGRYHRVVASERWCKCCLPMRCIGNELHALSSCKRAATTKMQCSLDLMDIFENAKVDTG